MLDEQNSTPEMADLETDRAHQPLTGKKYRTSTVELYSRRAESLLDAYSTEKDAPWAADPMGFVRWFYQRAEGWKHSTFRMSRLALLYLLERQNAPVEVLNHLAKVKHRQHDRSPQDKSSSISGDAKRVRRFPDSDLNAYLAALQPGGAQGAGARREGAFDYLLWLFLKWNVHVGLRPSEVGDMEIVHVKGDAFLTIRNRKVNDTRGNGDFRMLALRPELLEDALRIMAERDRFFALGLQWGEVQSGMMRRMQQVRNDIGGPTYTMYSTRHQFAANAKASGFSKQEVADRMGHASIETAQSCYGKKMSGRRGGAGVEAAHGVTAEQLKVLRDSAQRARPYATPNSENAQPGVAE